MNTAAGALSLASGTPPCPQCARPMEAHDRGGHYGQRVPTDICPHCNLVWFDEFESVRLSGLGWGGLLRRMQAAMANATGPLKPQLDCPRCRLTLRPVSNLTRFGRFASLKCPRKHGHLQTFSLLLAERGMVRPLGRADLRTLAKEGRGPAA
jgi:transposase-like protein